MNLEQVAESRTESPVASLIATLRAFNRPIPARTLRRIMGECGITPDDVRSWCTTSEKKYTRNTIYSNDHFELLLLVWLPGQGSPIHNHKNSVCGFRILSGVGTEIRYEKCPLGLWYPERTKSFPVGSFCGSYDEDTHQVVNLQQETLQTLHVYSPPLKTMEIVQPEQSVLGSTYRVAA